MALEIRPSTSASSSTESAKSSRSKSSGTDLFSIDLGAKKAAPAPARQPTTTAKKAPAAKTPGATAKASPQQPRASDVSAASGKPAANKDTSSSDQNARSSDEDTSSDSSSRTTANSKGRSAATPAPTPARNPIAAAQAKTAAQDAEQGAANESGLSLLQVLAHSLEGGDSDTTTVTDTPAATSSAKETSDEKAQSALETDPNAQALALFTQALAAALGVTATAPQAPANHTGPAGNDQAAQTVADPTSKLSAGQDLVTLLAQKIAVDAKGKTDTDAIQTSTTEARSAATQQSAAAQQSTDASAGTATPLAHLGVASHFSVQHPQAPANSPAAGELKSPVGSSAWNDELGGHLTWMTQKGLESGSLRVAPEHLGPVEVQITVHNGDASVWFGAGHPDTRAALEQALPRLREMFASQGMTLTDSGVSRESPRNLARNPSTPAVGGVTAVASADVSAPGTVRASLGLVDTYA